MTKLIARGQSTGNGIVKDNGNLIKASQGYDFGSIGIGGEISVIRGYSDFKYNPFNQLYKNYLYRIFPIPAVLLKALTGKSLVHPYFCVKSIS